MKLIFFGIFAIAVCDSARIEKSYHFTNLRHPIQDVSTSTAENGGFERVDGLNARIYPFHHLNSERVNFPTSGPIEARFRAMKTDKDERGHLVASQFSGPPEWYNLSPQSMRVNRNAQYQSLTTDWYGTECKVAEYLSEGRQIQGDSQRHVIWTVNMTYDGDSIRPKEYKLQVEFWDGLRHLEAEDIQGDIPNTPQSEGDSLWVCRGCRGSHNYEPCTVKSKKSN